MTQSTSRLIKYTRLSLMTNDSSLSTPLTSNAEEDNYNIQEWIKGQYNASDNKEVKRIFNDMLLCLQGQIYQINHSHLQNIHLDFNLIKPFIDNIQSKPFFHHLFMCVYLNYFGANQVTNISKALTLFYTISHKNDISTNLSEDVTLKSKMDKNTAKKIITNIQNKISIDTNILSVQKNDIKNQEQLIELYASPNVFNAESVLHEILMGLILPEQNFQTMVTEFQNISPIACQVIENEHKNVSINISQNIKYLRQRVLNIILPDRFKIPDADNIHALDILLNYIFNKDISLIYKVDTLLSFRQFINCQSLEDIYQNIHQEEQSLEVPTSTETKFLCLLKSTICAVAWIHVFLESNKSFLLSMSNGEFINCLKDNTIYFANNKFYIYFQNNKFSSTCYRTLVYKYGKSSSNSICYGSSNNSTAEY